nr:MAG TPA: AAA ATPase [Bacteriophage sp.]
MLIRQKKLNYLLIAMIYSMVTNRVGKSFLLHFIKKAALL